MGLLKYSGIPESNGTGYFHPSFPCLTLFSLHCRTASVPSSCSSCHYPTRCGTASPGLTLVLTESLGLKTHGHCWDCTFERRAFLMVLLCSTWPYERRVHHSSVLGAPAPQDGLVQEASTSLHELPCAQWSASLPGSPAGDAAQLQLCLEQVSSTHLAELLPCSSSSVRVMCTLCCTVYD